MEVVREMSIKNARKLRNTLLLSGLLIMLLGYLYEPLLVVGAVLALSCLVPDFMFNKCPHCGEHLGRNEDAFCQHCGGRVD